MAVFMGIFALLVVVCLVVVLLRLRARRAGIHAKYSLRGERARRRQPRGGGRDSRS